MRWKLRKVGWAMFFVVKPTYYMTLSGVELAGPIKFSKIPLSDHGFHLKVLQTILPPTQPYPIPMYYASSYHTAVIEWRNINCTMKGSILSFYLIPSASPSWARFWLVLAVTYFEPWTSSRCDSHCSGSIPAGSRLSSPSQIQDSLPQTHGVSLLIIPAKVSSLILWDMKLILIILYFFHLLLLSTFILKVLSITY